MRIEADEIVVESSAVERVIVQGHASAARCISGPVDDTGAAKPGPIRDSPWIRVTVIDAAGRQAWSNPIWRG